MRSDVVSIDGAVKINHDGKDMMCFTAKQRADLFACGIELVRNGR